MGKWVFIWVVLFPSNNGHVVATAAQFEEKGECEWVRARAIERFAEKNVEAECRELGGQ